MVVLDKSAYLIEMKNILSDHDTYVLLRGDPVGLYKSELENLVSKAFAQGIINKKDFSFFVPASPRKPVMYYLHKDYKNAT